MQKVCELGPNGAIENNLILGKKKVLEKLT